jgi:hypothetical protein
MLSAFQKRIVHFEIFGGFKTDKIGPDQFSKTPSATQRNMLSNRSQHFKVAVF